MCTSLLGHYCPDVIIIIIFIMPFFTLQSGLLIGILDYIVPLDFDHIKLVSKPGPKEWPYPPALPNTPFPLMPCGNSVHTADSKVETSTEEQLRASSNSLLPTSRSCPQLAARPGTEQEHRSCLAGSMEQK